MTTCGIRTLVRDHVSILKILQLIFKHDLKFVRPLKLFSSHARFCSTLFDSGKERHGEDTAMMEKMGLERKALMDKLNEIEDGLGRRTVKELGWDELLLI